jgi:tRNA threonylcarbamoyladenosine biosynthesis protein TsaE
MMAKLKILNTFKTETEEQTILKGYEFAKILKKGDLILLNGEIGSGKTTFLNGVVTFLGSKKRVISSSFTVMSVYKTKKMDLIHFDLYRLNGNIDYFMFMEYLDKGIVAVEWSYNNKFYIRFLPYTVDISFGEKNSRIIRIGKYE